MRKYILLLAAVLLFGCSKLDSDIRQADRLRSGAQHANKQAVDLYRKVLERCRPGQKKDQVRFKLANLYYEQGRFKDAAAQLTSVEMPEARTLLAKSLYKDSDFTSALEVFNQIGEEGAPEYLYFYGTTLEKNNLYDKALRLYAMVGGDPSFGASANERVAAINLITHQESFGGIDEELKRAIQESPSQEEYPDAAVLYLLVDENFQLTEDNRLVTEAHYVIKILNDRGKEGYGEVSLTYDSTYEKLELEYARTITPDGTVVTVGDKNIRDVSLYLNYPLYSNARARIISMPDVNAGSVIEYKVRITRSQLPNKKDFDTVYWLATDEPILLQRSVISIPKNRTMRFKTMNGQYNSAGFDMTPKVAEDGAKRLYSVEFRNVPQIIPEVGMPPVSRVDPYILFSTFESWGDIHTWWRDLYQEKIVADEAIKAKVRELIKDKKTPEEKIRSIYNFCAQEIRYVAVEYGEAGHEPHQASEIFKNKYGDCKDKAILLISMLAEAGIEAYPVLISTFGSLDVQEDLPGLVFNHAIAATRLDGKLIFMDVTGSTTSFRDLPPDDQDRLTMVFFKDKYQLLKTPLFDAGHNNVLTEMKIKINKDESIEGQRHVKTHGAYEQAQRFWLKYTMPVLIEEQLKAKVRTIADNAQLGKYEITNVEDLDMPVGLTYTFSAPQYLKKAGKARILDQLGGLSTAGLFKEERRYPIEASALTTEETIVEIELPAHLALKYLPPPVVLDTKWFRYLIQYEPVGKNVIRFRSVNVLKDKEVAITDYPAYKKAIEEVAVQVNQQVILEETR
ncbi:MAG: DUF3857 domain-containing protein [Candidatus Omnitrophota bacterium]